MDKQQNNQLYFSKENGFTNERPQGCDIAVDHIVSLTRGDMLIKECKPADQAENED